MALSAAEIRQRVGKDDPIIIEVGANCGQTTIDLLQAIPGATIHAFEPDPRAIAKFRDTVVNPNVHLYECAIGAVNGSISFHQSSGAEHLAGYQRQLAEEGLNGLVAQGHGREVTSGAAQRLQLGYARLYAG